jgi:ribosomal protein S18 acetylase RimI-like enzyme
MSAEPSPSLDLRAVGEGEIAACFPLLRQLRPQLGSVDAFATRWRRQSADGYRLLALWRGAIPLALAGYRFQETLVHGRFVYVDDLVTDAAARGEGLGGRLLAALKAEAKANDCARLVLDTALDNVRAHRFYYRQGLLAGALRFNLPLG